MTKNAPYGIISTESVAYSGKAVTPPHGEVIAMVTFTELFQFSLVIIGVISLCYTIFSKKK